MKRIWNIIIWMFAIIIGLSSLLYGFLALLTADWKQVGVHGFIVFLVIYGLYAKFWRKKGNAITDKI